MSFKKGHIVTQETKNKIRQALIGRKLSPEHRAKCKFGRLGKEPWNKGIPMEEDVRIRMINSLKGRHLSPNTEFKEGNYGKKAGHWKNGKIFRDGYILIYKPNHPFASQGKYVPEHRLVMEKKIGRFLTKQERVHHINGNKADNRLKNLLYFPNESEHQKYHYHINHIPT